MAMREIPQPEIKSFYKFNAIGDVFKGLFVGTSEGTYGTEYDFKTKNGLQSVSPGKALVKQLIAAQLKPGYLVEITFIAEKDTGVPNQSPMKLFRVRVDDAPNLKAAPPAAPVDADIPF